MPAYPSDVVVSEDVVPDVVLELGEQGARRLLVFVGAALLAGGVPVHEVEDEVCEVGRRLGLGEVEVAAYPTNVTLSLGHGSPSTVETVRGALRLDQTAEANAIAAGLRDGSLAPAAALERLMRLRRRPHRYRWTGFQLGHVLVAAGIALVLEPTWRTLLFSVLYSPVVSTLMRLSSRRRLLGTLLPLVASFLVALGAFAAGQHGLLPSPLRAALPTLAVLFPGATIVTGLSELAAGAMVAGTARLVYGSTQLLLFAIGVAAAAVLLRVPPAALQNVRVDTIGPVGAVAGLVLLTLGMSLMESVRPALVPWILGIISCTYAAQVAGMLVVPNPWFGALLGATAASLGSTLVEFVRPSLPRVVVFLPSFWLLVPGSLGLVSLTQLGLQPALAGSTIAVSTSIVCAIAIGIIVGTSIARSLRLVARSVRRHSHR